jgi:hypothetical protein
LIVYAKMVEKMIDRLGALWSFTLPVRAYSVLGCSIYDSMTTRTSSRKISANIAKLAAQDLLDSDDEMTNDADADVDVDLTLVASEGEDEEETDSIGNGQHDEEKSQDSDSRKEGESKRTRRARVTLGRMRVRRRRGRMMMMEKTRKRRCGCQRNASITGAGKSRRVRGTKCYPLIHPN